MLSETLLHLEKGQRVSPFEGKTEFLPVDFEELLKASYNSHFPKEEPVLTTGVEFEGVRGMVSLVASSRIDTERASTPLGPVMTEIEYTDSEVIVRQIPLQIRLFFELHSQQDWQKLLSNRIIFDMENDRYLVRYNHQENRMTVLEFEKALADFKVLPAISYLVDLRRLSRAHPLLPLNLSSLSGIGMTVSDTFSYDPYLRQPLIVY